MRARATPASRTSRRASPVAPDDLKGLARFAREQAIDLTVVGPELPLTLGLVDRFARGGAARVRAHRRRGAARGLEGVREGAAARSSACRRAFFGAFDEPEDAARFIDEVGAPVVVKADGLAAGKGVFICQTVADAKTAVDQVMAPAAVRRRRRTRGRRGVPARRGAVVHGDHRRRRRAAARRSRRITSASSTAIAARTPAAWARTRRCRCMTPALRDHVMRDIMQPVVDGLARQGMRYTGVLYAGLMVHDGTRQGARVQRPLRRPGGAGADDAPDVGSGRADGRRHPTAPSPT